MQVLLKKIIRTGVGGFRFWMATLGMGIAVFFILLAVQTHANFRHLLYGESNAADMADFLVIQKQVLASNAGNKDKSGFTDAEIELLRSQPFVTDLGVMSSTNFAVTISSYSDALPFYTDAYFESVPDGFIDVKSDQWSWKQGQMNVPVIIPSFFMDLYNTGMAMSQQALPQLSMEVLKAIPLRIELKGQGVPYEITGHIAGASDRLNAVLVPQSFMDWANARYGYAEQRDPSRVVIKTNDPADPRLTAFLDEQQWKTNSDKTRFSRVRVIVNWIVGIVGAIGAIMLVFGMLVFTLFIQLTIAACRSDIGLLQTLGVSPGQLQSFLMKLFMPVNVVVVIAAFIAIGVLQYILYAVMQPRQIYLLPYPDLLTLAASVLLLFSFWFTNRYSIRKYLQL